MSALTRRVAVLVVIFVGLIGLDWLAVASRRQVDLTADKTQTLTAESRNVVGALNRRVRATAFFGPQDPNRVSAPGLLARYGRLSRRLSYKILDPEKAPAAARDAGIDPTFGGIAVSDGTRTEHAATATEQDVTAALARLIRGKAHQVCLTVGHGEPDPTATTDDGMATTMTLLTRNGYAVRAIDLLVQPIVPSGCDALLIGAPTAALGAAQPSVVAYLARGGRGVVLTDPASSVDMGGVLAPYGIAVDRGIVVEGDAASRFPDDPTRPIVREYRSASPIVRRLAPTFFPGAQALVLDTHPPVGVATDALGASSADSYLDHDPSQPQFDPGTDRAGPITLVASTDRSSNEGDHVLRTRLVVTGDVDFATNAFVEQGGNAALLVRALDWVTLQESLVTVSANLPRARPLDLTEGRLTYARLLLAGAVPLLFLLLGAMVFAVQRAR